jgi:hypothetical protein
MKEEDIEKAAAIYQGKALGYNGPTVIAMNEAFKNGANWRINSVWHSCNIKPDKGKLLLVEDIDSAYDLAYLSKSKPWEELSEKNHYTRWAYIENLLPSDN